jgi:hypothetical protein
MHCYVVIHVTVPCRWMTPTSVRPDSGTRPGREGQNLDGLVELRGLRLAGDIVRLRRHDAC